MAEFSHFDLKLIAPNFDSELLALILELEKLRDIQITPTTPKQLYKEIKSIFHLLESVGSARIEGNRTTVGEYVDQTRFSSEKTHSQSVQEILNAEALMNFVEEHMLNGNIDAFFFKRCHEILVQGLSPEKEGDMTPGEYRKKNVSISGSSHSPPNFLQVPEYMQELFAFIQKPEAPQFDLIKSCLVNHRIAWVHPFTNGNGRIGRGFLYACLLAYGFSLKKGRIVNPVAIFCTDRKKYYQMLEKADSGKKEDLLAWCQYVLQGLTIEITKLEKLANYTFVKDNLLVPMIQENFVGDLKKVLLVAVEKKEFQASDIKHIFSSEVAHTHISRFLRTLKQDGTIVSITPNSRKYRLSISGKIILKLFMRKLDAHDFLPLKNEV